MIWRDVPAWAALVISLGAALLSWRTLRWGKQSAQAAMQSANEPARAAYRFRIEFSPRRRHAVSGNLLQRSVHFIRRWYQLDVLRVRRSCPSRLHTELCSTQ